MYKSRKHDLIFIFKKQHTPFFDASAASISPAGVTTLVLDGFDVTKTQKTNSANVSRIPELGGITPKGYG